MIEITDIAYMNGERHLVDYDYRKKQFSSKAEMETYRQYLEKRIGKQLFLTYRELLQPATHSAT